MRGFLVALLFCFIFCSPSYAIKIGLQTDVHKTYIGASEPANIIDGNTNKILHQMEKMKGYDFKPSGKHIAVKISGTFYTLPTDNIVIKTEPNAYLCVKNTWYRGFFRILNNDGKLTVINEIDIENYIKGVVPAEMPKNWELDAYKAQAIAARSYAMANMGKRSAYGYDLNDKPADQAYKGASSETEITQQAVDETKGIVLICNNEIIPAFYCSAAGGQTKTAQEVWHKDLAYIKSVPSYDENVKRNGHGVGMSQHGANNMAKNGYNFYQILQHFYANIQFARLKPQYME